MMLKAGTLRERVAFDARSEVADGAGNFRDEWSQRYSCSAMILDMRGGEQVLADRLAQRKPVIVTVRDCRAVRAVGSDWRVRDVRRGTVYNIRDINPARETGFIEFLCETGVAVG